MSQKLLYRTEGVRLSTASVAAGRKLSHSPSSFHEEPVRMVRDVPGFIAHREFSSAGRFSPSTSVADPTTSRDTSSISSTA